MAVIGNKLASGVGLTYLTVDDSSNNQIAVAQPELEMPSAGYITRLGVWAAKAGGSGSAYLWLGLYALDEAGAPTTLLARTARLVLGAAQDISGALAWVNPVLNPTSQTAVRMVAGQRFAIGIKCEDATGGDVTIAYYGVVLTTHHLRTFNTPNTPPSNPFTPSGTASRFPLAVYAEWTENTKPTAAIIAPTHASAQASTTPTITGTFTDPQSGAPIVDRMSAYELEVIRTSDSVVMLGGPGAVYVASAVERAANAFSRVYAGAALTAGPTYQLRARVADDSGAWSDWTATPHTFTISARGRVDTATDGVPSGKVDTDTILIDWTGRWNHPSGHSTNAVQVFIYRGGSLYRTGLVVAKTVASSALPGAAFTVQDTEAGIGALPAGDYTYRIAGRSATDQLWSEQSPDRAFVINSRPTTPTDLQPPAGASSSSRPLLEMHVSDPDADDVEGVDVDFQFEITTPGDVTTVYTATNYDAARGVAFLQTTSTHVGANGTYKWRGRGRDSSAGALGEGMWSDYSTFVYTAGPVVTITNPSAEGEVENTTTPTFAWSNTGGAQVRARVLLYLDDDKHAKNAKDISGATQTFTPPPGWLVKGQSYDLAVSVVLAGEVIGTSGRRRFSIDYTNPVAPTNVQVTPYTERRDYYAAPSSLMVSFDQSIYGPGEFAGYNIYRRKASEEEHEAVLLRTLTNAGQTQWRDAWVPSRTLMLYGVSQMRNVGGIIVESPITWVEGEVALVVPVLVSALDPSIRFPCMYMERDYGGKDERPKAYYTTWGSKNKRIKATVPHDSSAQTVRMTVTCKSDERGHLYDHVADLTALVVSGHTLLFRSENPAERFYCDLDWEWQRGGVGERNMKMVLTEVDFTPGSAGGT